MARMRAGVHVQGAHELIAKMKNKRRELVKAIDMDVEKTTLETINEARRNAPKLTRQLTRGLQLVPQETQLMSRTWTGTAEYTARQEYEHKTKRGFMRKAQWNARNVLRIAVRETLKRIGGKL